MVAKRSIYRDTECQFYFYSTCPAFNEILQKETDHIYQHAKPVTLAMLKKDPEIRLGPFTRLLSKLTATLL